MGELRMGLFVLMGTLAGTALVFGVIALAIGAFLIGVSAIFAAVIMAACASAVL